MNKNRALALFCVSLIFTGCCKIKANETVTAAENGVSLVRTQQTTSLYTADIEYPRFEGEKKLNRSIQKTAKKWFAEFQKEAKGNAAAGMTRRTADGEPIFIFQVGAEPSLDAPEMVSLLMTGYSYTGGANGSVLLKSFTYDRKQKKALTLTDVLPSYAADLNALAAFCRKQLIQKWKAEKDEILSEMIEIGTAPIPENYSVFTLTENGLTVYFAKYQVAPGAYGIQAVQVPPLKADGGQK